jgi:heterotetrameric sarcosine oxidase gamma subunit
MSPTEVISGIESGLANLLHAATDASSALACFNLKGPAARTVLGMGCGLDLHREVFQAGHCARTRFANVAVIIVAVGDDEFDLYVDRSVSKYLNDWLVDAGQDSLTQSSQYERAPT